MRIRFLLILSLLFPVILSAQSARKEASRVNDRAEALFHKAVAAHRHDSAAIYRDIVEDVRLSVRCDSLDRSPDRRGRIRPRYEDVNSERLLVLHPRLINAGQFYLRHKQVNEGVDALKLYMTVALNPLLEGEEDESGIAAYYLAYHYLQAHRYDLADQMADFAIDYETTEKPAAEIKAQCMAAQMITRDDSLRYQAVLRKLYESDPTNNTYFAWVVKFYEHPSRTFNIENFIDKQLENHSSSVIPWILKGEMAMRGQRWDEAIEAYKQADELNPEIVPLIYNIGVCLNTKAIDLKKRLDAKAAKGDFVDRNQYLDIFAQARLYLERVRAKDPRRNKVDWVPPLYMDYTILGDKIKAAELEPLVDKFKNKN